MKSGHTLKIIIPSMVFTTISEQLIQDRTLIATPNYSDSTRPPRWSVGCHCELFSSTLSLHRQRTFPVGGQRRKGGRAEGERREGEGRTEGEAEARKRDKTRRMVIERGEK